MYVTVVQDGKLFMISYPELNEFAKLCFADDINGMLCTLHSDTPKNYFL